MSGPFNWSAPPNPTPTKIAALYTTNQCGLVSYLFISKYDGFITKYLMQKLGYFEVAS